MTQKIAKILAGIVILCSVLVMLSWIFDFTIIASIYPGWITMKFNTALSFLFSGVLLYCLAGIQPRWNIAIPIFTLLILLLIIPLAISTVLGVPTEFEELFVKEKPGAAATPFAGRPAIPTMISFLLIAYAGAAAASLNNNNKNTYLFTGIVIFIISLTAVAGYLLRWPTLYYQNLPYTNPIAFTTALLFIITGAALMLLTERQR